VGEPAVGWSAASPPSRPRSIRPPDYADRLADLSAAAHLYSKEEIAALLTAAGALRWPFRAATYRTLIGLLGVTGMRVGEALQLDCDDVDLHQGPVGYPRGSGRR
jgi:integrase